MMALDATVERKRERRGEARPSFFGAFLGLWSFTWRTGTAWGKMPAFLASTLSIPVLTLLTVGGGESSAYYRWIVDFYFLLILPLYALSVCGGMIREELQADTLYFLTTRPLTRARLLVLKYLCHMGWLQLAGLLNLALLLGVGAWRGVPELGSLLAVWLPSQVLAIAAWSALSALIGLISPRYLVLGIIYGFIVEIGIGRIPTNINALSLTRNLQKLLAHHAPLSEQYGWTTEGALYAGLILGVATILFLGAAAALFTFREYHHAEEMQK